MANTSKTQSWKLEANGPKKLIGMVHLGATPGTPGATLTPDQIVSQAVSEARLLADAGFDAVILENMHDTPYVHGDDLGPEVATLMARALNETRREIDRPIGIQILSGGNRHAMACAHNCGGSFIRCENFVFSHVADEGLLAKAEAGPLLRYRSSIGAGSIPVYCDIKKKHASHAITADLDVGEIAHAAEFCGADGLIVTGVSTGQAAEIQDVRRVRESCQLPILVGSGVTAETAANLLGYADALIVGSWIKQGGTWKNPVDGDRARTMVNAMGG
ncbi:MAG: BtpA/SgcQ family protein [Phycisphaerales bacterium]